MTKSKDCTKQEGTSEGLNREGRIMRGAARFFADNAIRFAHSLRIQSLKGLDLFQLGVLQKRVGPM